MLQVLLQHATQRAATTITSISSVLTAREGDRNRDRGRGREMGRTRKRQRQREGR